MEELRIYIVSFDRPGYGESDPNLNGSPKSIALDIEELADGLGLGPKFYLFGLSMGGEITWACLNYIPHRYFRRVCLCLFSKCFPCIEKDFNFDLETSAKMCCEVWFFGYGLC